MAREPGVNVKMSNPSPKVAQTVADRVRAIISESLGVDLRGDHEQLTSDLRADSMDVVEIVMQLETEFEIEIPDEDGIDNCSEHCPVGQVIAYIERRVAAKACA